MISLPFYFSRGNSLSFWTVPLIPQLLSLKHGSAQPRTKRTEPRTDLGSWVQVPGALRFWTPSGSLPTPPLPHTLGELPPPQPYQSRYLRPTTGTLASWSSFSHLYVPFYKEKDLAILMGFQEKYTHHHPKRTDQRNDKLTWRPPQGYYYRYWSAQQTCEKNIMANVSSLSTWKSIRHKNGKGSRYK